MRASILLTRRDPISGRIQAMRIPNPNYRPRVKLPFTFYVVDRYPMPRWFSNKRDAVAWADYIQTVDPLHARNVWRVRVENKDDALKALNNFHKLNPERIHTA